MSHNALQRIRDLLAPSALRTVEERFGYLDLLPSSPDQPQRRAQRAMNNPLVVAVYEGPWRWGTALLVTGMTETAERRRAASALHVGGSDRILDVACGPGNFTTYLGGLLDGNGLAIGVDYSVPMLRRAVQVNAGEQVGYLRADARLLPFPDGSFDAVCCFAALYLMPDPYQVLEEMIRVLTPGGRIAVMTSCLRGPRPIRTLSARLAATQGLHGFDRSDITSRLVHAGFDHLRQDVKGLSQFVSATKTETSPKPAR